MRSALWDQWLHSVWKKPLGVENTSQKGLFVGTGKNEVGKATFFFFLQVLLVKKLGQSKCSNLFDMSPV